MSDLPTIAVLAQNALANDGTINLDELRSLLQLANADGTIDAEEKLVLLNLFQKLTPKMVTPDVWTWIKQIRSIHMI